MVADRDAVYGIQTAPVLIDVDGWADVGASPMEVVRGGFGSGTRKRAGTVPCTGAVTTNGFEAALMLPNRLAVIGSMNNPVNRSETAEMFDLVLRIPARCTGTPATSAQLDVEVRIDDTNGGVSADLVTTAAQNMLTAGAGTWVDYDFVISGAGGLDEGDVLNIVGRIVLNDTGGLTGGIAEMGPATVFLCTRG